MRFSVPQTLFKAVLRTPFCVRMTYVTLFIWICNFLKIYFTQLHVLGLQRTAWRALEPFPTVSSGQITLLCTSEQLATHSWAHIQWFYVPLRITRRVLYVTEPADLGQTWRLTLYGMGVRRLFLVVRFYLALRWSIGSSTWPLRSLFEVR